MYSIAAQVIVPDSVRRAIAMPDSTLQTDSARVAKIMNRGAKVSNFTVVEQGDSVAVQFDKKSMKAAKKQQLIVDTIEHYKMPNTFFKPVPSRSVWYSLICPGLGQIYNRRYWKLPIVYTGFAALIYGVSRTGSRYNEYVRGYRDFSDTDPNTKSYENLVPLNYPNSSIESYLSGRVNNFRRYRDLCIVGIVAWYAISVVDAFVDATLADFDVSPDLTMRVGAKVMEDPANTLRPAMGVQMQLCF
ncbi:MAG: DUF5683 domain-containing protein [Paludibacteraceae bacterium]|nr:DUF5683 domain-containing protein [Paludibacteraceae bacterium]